MVSFDISLFVFSSTGEINVISFAYLFINTEKRKRIFLTFKTLEYFQNNLLQKDSNQVEELAAHNTVKMYVID